MAYCSSCGSDIPDGQGSSCSMCYGDPYHGSDGYYLHWLEEQDEIEQEREHSERLEYERMENERLQNENDINE